MVKVPPDTIRGASAWPSSQTRHTTLLASPSGSVTVQSTVTDANVVSDRWAAFGLPTSVTSGGRFLNLNSWRAGFGSRTPRSLIARASKTAAVNPVGVSTVITLSVCVVKRQALSADAAGFSRRTS